MEAVAQGFAGFFAQEFGHLRGSSVRWRRRSHEVFAEDPEVADEDEAVTQTAPSHGLSEAQLRELIAQDLRSFMRSPLTPSPSEGASPARPFLLDRLMGSAG